MAGQPAARTKYPGDGSAGHRYGVRAICRFRRPISPGSDAATTCGWIYTAKGVAGIRGALQILQTGFDPERSPCRIKTWGAFGSLLDELHHPAPGSPFRRIFEEQLRARRNPDLLSAGPVRPCPPSDARLRQAASGRPFSLAVTQHFDGQ